MIELGDQTKWQKCGLEYLRYQYDLKPTDLVLDIGSYRREFADEIIRKYGCKVECFDGLDGRAAWKFDGTVRMGGNYLYTSIYEENGRDVNCVDIARFLDKEVALCKINIEGGEYELIDYILRKGLINNIKNLQVQFHKVETIPWQALYDQIERDLEKTHKQTWRYPFVWENWQIN